MSESKESHVERLHKKLQQKNRQRGIGSFIQAIEDDFILSWDRVEGLYENHPFKSEIVAFLHSLREKGYDKSLRAGQSLWTLMFSRSLRHGLRPEQPFIYFYFSENGMTYGFHNSSQPETLVSEIKLTPHIEQILQFLQQQTID